MGEMTETTLKGGKDAILMKWLFRNHTFIKLNWKLLRANHQEPIANNQYLNSSCVKGFIPSFTERREYKCDCSVELKGLQIH